MVRSAWMARVFEILATSGPQPIDTLVAEAGGLIPPGLAFRNRESVRNWRRERDGGQATAAEATDKAIWSGRRRMIVHSLWSAKRDGLLDLYDRDGKKWARFIREAKPPPSYMGLRAIEALSTPSARSAAQKKAWETRRKLGRMGGPISPEQREKLNAGLRALSPERRSEMAKKGWVTRRARDG